MTTPSAPSPLLQALTALNENIGSLTTAQRDTSNDISDLVVAVREESAARDRKVDTLRRTNIFLLGLAALLVLLAVFNFVSIREVGKTSRSAQSTNQLLLGCLQPNTVCSNANAQGQAAVLNQIRQTQFVISVCQRQNPLPPKATQSQIASSTSKLISCVQDYYPGFQLPVKSK